MTSVQHTEEKVPRRIVDMSSNADLKKIRVRSCYPLIVVESNREMFKRDAVSFDDDLQMSVSFRDDTDAPMDAGRIMEQGGKGHLLGHPETGALCALVLYAADVELKVALETANRLLFGHQAQ